MFFSNFQTINNLLIFGLIKQASKSTFFDIFSFLSWQNLFGKILATLIGLNILDGLGKICRNEVLVLRGDIMTEEIGITKEDFIDILTVIFFQVFSTLTNQIFFSTLIYSPWNDINELNWIFDSNFFN